MPEVEVRQAVPLRTLHGIELAAVGTWKASTGETTFTAQDFTDAVAALECPGVRNPVIKLGHDETDSTSGVRWDGEPAVGWISNMRFDGAKILGDLTGLPAWLADAQDDGLSVLAAAYPDRSIEIYRPFTCQIGHTHPSVITALSLLGVYAPGVGVLKSMQDVYAAWTVPVIEPTQARAMLSTSVRLAAAERRDLSDIERRAGVDLDQLDSQWQEALDAMLEVWPELSEAQRDELAAQIEQAVDDEPDALGTLAVSSAAVGAALLAAMTTVAAQAAAGQIAEAKHQGVTVPAADLGEDLVRATAEAIAAAMAASTASAAGRAAAQKLGTGSGQDVAAAVLADLADYTDRFPHDQFGGALSAAQAAGRLAVVESYTGNARYFASEALDTSTCQPCRDIDLTEFPDLDTARAAYGAGKYAACLGRERCRGHLITIFGSDRASAPTTIRTNLGGPMGDVVKASVSVEQISRAYYEKAGYSMWITEMQVDPLTLIAADDATGKYYRIPVELNGDAFEFADPQEVAVSYVDVKAAASAPVQWQDRSAALLAAGKNADGTDRVAPDVTPAGAAIRTAMDKTKTAAPAVLETEVETPDADPATGPATNPKEASVDAAKMREALGLGPDATDDEVSTAFAAQLSTVTPPTPDPASTLLSALPKDGGAILMDPENYKSLVSMAAQGQHAYEQMQRNERDTVLGAAVKDGRFPVSRLSTYSQMWDKDPAATKAYIELMPKNSVPVMAAGFLGAEISQNETDIAYDAMYGKAGA